MNTLAPRETERAFQGAVIDLAERLGWTVAHFSDSRRQIAPGRFVGDRRAAGWPDLAMVRERLIIVEVKGPKTAVTQLQRGWLLALEQASVEVYLWRAPGDWDLITQVLTDRRPHQ